MSIVGWKDFSYSVDLSRLPYKNFFIRTDALPSNADSQIYDSSLFTICAVSAGTIGTYAGDLFVEYEIELMKPKMNPALLGSYGVYATTTAASVAAFVASPFAGYNAAKVSYFPSSVQEPLVTEATRKITFPSPGTYDVSFQLSNPGNTADVFNAANPMFSVDTPGTAIVNTLPTGVSAPSAGEGWVTSVKVAVLVANAVITMAALAGVGTSSSVVSTLRIAVEAAPFVLSYLGAPPVPPLDDLTFAALKKCYPKYDLSAFERARQIHQFEKDHQEYKRQKLMEMERKEVAEGEAEKEFKLRRESRTEEFNKITLDESGSDVEVNVSRSSSREPGSKKSKKADLKNRKV